MQSPASFVIAEGPTAQAVRDALAAAGVVLWATDLSRSGKLIAVRSSGEDLGAMLSRGSAEWRFEVFAAPLPEAVLADLSEGGRMLVQSALAPALKGANPLAGASWDTAGVEAPHKLERQGGR